ncbi:HAMP domain-containing protein [bacterium]|nr:HAMP domain-containing protein [bacterium]
MKGFFSIRSKFLGVMSLLLVSCLVVYLLIAVEVFKTDKTELVFDLNRSMVSNLSVEFETEFKGVSDKFKLFALLSSHGSLQSISDNLFSDDSEVVYASLYRQNQTAVIKNFTNKKYLETYGLKNSFFEDTLHNQRKIPFNEILKNGEHFWNASVEGGAPLIGYGRSVVVEDNKGQPTDHLAVIGYIKPDKILKALSYVKVSEVSVLDHNGRLLIHPDFEKLKQAGDFSENPLFKTAQQSKVNLSVATFNDESSSYLGAFSRSYRGKIFVLARASQGEAFSAVYQLVSRSVSFALIAVTLSLLFAFLLSRSLTEPISILVEGMEKVSGGDLSTNIEVKSKDETQLLATSFNQMIRDLKQSRDDLQEINRDLDKKVKDRTLQLEIQNRAVKEAQEALLKTTRLASAGEIAGRAAHEVLNPLTGMLTRLSGIEKRVHTQIEPQLNLMKDIFHSWKQDHSNGGFPLLVQSWEQKSQVDESINLWQEDLHNLKHVQDSFENLLQTIDGDVKFLQQESGRINKIISGMRKLSSLNSDVKSHSVNNLLIDCRNIMADLFTESSVSLNEIFTAEPDSVEVDRDEFIQAVTNLMRNSLQAIKHSQRDMHYHLKISTFSADDRISIEISDNGPGVPEIYQKMLFEKQFTTKSGDEGTGLGLGISRRFIRAHGGDIEFVSSDPYVKTTFRITLPKKISSIKEGAA